VILAVGLLVLLGVMASAWFFGGSAWLQWWAAGLGASLFGVFVWTAWLVRHHRLTIERHETRLHTETTERIQAELRIEAAARQTEGLERENRAKSQFLSRMSHELRTPLNAVLGFAQLLEMDQLTPKQLANVRQILTGGRNLLELINEVLDISRLDSGRTTLAAEPVPLPDLLSDCVGTVRTLAEGRRVTVTLAAADVPPVRGDAQALKQALGHLVTNAIQYNREGGSVTVTATAGPDRVRLSVRDTGLGLTPEQTARLFTPFERLDAARLGVPGTGLGLTLCKRLIEAMGGRIGVESTVGEGSTFWVELQRAKED
jgi:signal transduction histidine kinase